MKKSASLCIILGLLSSGAGIVACNGGGGSGDGSTTVQDIVAAQGMVYLTDGKTAVQNLSIAAYNWVVSYSDGSTVTVPLTPATDGDAATSAIVTGPSGTFTFGTNQLQLVSGTEVQACNNVCVDWEQGEDDTCTDWATDYTDFCASWSSGGETCYSNGETCGSCGTSCGSSGGSSCGTCCTSNGSTCTPNGDVCDDWETEADSYCDAWDTSYYTYCAATVQDCGMVYPTRHISDIASAYSDITYSDAVGGTVTTASLAHTLANVGYQKPTSSTLTNGDTVQIETWVQNDQFTTTLTAQPVVPSASIGLAEIAARGQMTAARNAAVHPRHYRKHYAGQGLPLLGRQHAGIKNLGMDQLTALQKLNLEMARTAAGATALAH